jgi:hypothetical protein
LPWFCQTRIGDGFQLWDIAEKDRASGTGFGARCAQAIMDTVIAEGALMDRARLRAQGDHSEGAGRDAGFAADADVILYEHVAHVGTDDGARWA